MPTSHQQCVLDVLREMRLLREDGTLGTLDSLSAVDFALELEARVGFEIPSERLRPQNFTSIEAIVAMLDDIASGSQVSGK